jgi:hypothetical protein
LHSAVSYLSLQINGTCWGYGTEGEKVVGYIFVGELFIFLRHKKKLYLTNISSMLIFFSFPPWYLFCQGFPSFLAVDPKPTCDVVTLTD